MDMTQLFAAFPQLSMMGGQKQMTTGTPQMLQLGIDPNAGANLEADKANWQRNAQMANILMQQGGDYIPNSGRAGILAGLASLIRGKMMESGQEDTLRDILQRQFKQDNEAAAAKHAQDLEDEDRKLRGEIFKGRELKKADLEFAPSQYAAGLGAFDPRTGQVTIDPNISAAKLAEKQAELALGAKYRAGPGPSGLQKAQAEIQEAVKAGLITPEEGQARLRATVLGSGGGNAPSGYRQSADGNLEPIPGGPADPATKGNQLQPVSAENRAKLGLLNAAQASLDNYKKAGMKDGVPTPFANNFTPGNTANTSMEDAIANVLRVESGAAISQGEIAAAKARYEPDSFRSDAENKNRVQMLENKLKSMREALTTGTNEAAPAAGGHKKGDVITVKGKQYRVVGGDPSDPDLAPL